MTMGRRSISASGIGALVAGMLLLLAAPPAQAQTPPPPCLLGSEVFADVPATHPFCPWIQQLHQDAITGGCAANPLRYCPGDFVTRGQMAVFLERVLHFPDVEVDNTFVGVNAGNRSTTGAGNTAVGARALRINTTGDNNTATGAQALVFNTTGQRNTATGVNALYGNSTGASNTAAGVSALQQNTTGSNNTATGDDALLLNSTGGSNTAIGYHALFNNITAFLNTAVGSEALANATGSGNTALGYSAGINVTTGSNNIHIGNFGDAADTLTIRIGGAGQQNAFIGGIFGYAVGGSNAPVLVDNTGKLGTVAVSSRRVKQDITDMGGASRSLLRLRPVTFRYRQEVDRDQQLEYGLIAEEVAEVFPELVVRDAAGAPVTVRYHVLPALLLNELQRQERALAEKDRELAELAATVADLAARLAQLEGRPVDPVRPVGEAP